MDRTLAVLELVYQASSARRSTAAAKRVVRALKVLGLDDAGVFRVMQSLEYAKWDDGESYSSTIKRVWTIPPTRYKK